MAKKRKPWPRYKRRPWNRPPPGAESGPVLSLVDPSLRRSYQSYLRSPAWKIHHKTYERLGNERLSDLSPLCSECHRAEHPEASPRDRGKERPSMGRRARSTTDIDRPHDSGQ